MKRFICTLFILSVCGCGLTGSKTSPPSTGLYIINVSPDAPAMDVRLNSNTIASAYTYGQDSGYFLNLPGTYQLTIAPTSYAASVSGSLVTLPAGKYYSIFLADSFSRLKVDFIVDPITTDTFSSAMVRFFDFCPNSPSLNASFTSNLNDTFNFTYRYFNDQSSVTGNTAFRTLHAGFYKLSLYRTDTALLIKSFRDITLSPGKYYTVYLKGVYGDLVKPLDTAIIRH